MCRPRVFLAVGLVFSFLLLAACGSSNSGSQSVTCSSLTPSDCGGDITGTWSLQSTCGNASVPIPGLPTECAGATINATPATPSGTAKFTGGSYNANLTLSFTMATQLSSACVSSVAAGGDVATTCNQIAQASSGQGYTFSCTPQGGGCSCTGTVSNTVADTGTYTTAGNQVTLNPTGGTPTPSTYCVRSSHLIMKFPSPFINTSDMFLVFAKQ